MKWKLFCELFLRKQFERKGGVGPVAAAADTSSHGCQAAPRTVSICSWPNWPDPYYVTDPMRAIVPCS